MSRSTLYLVRYKIAYYLMLFLDFRLLQQLKLLSALYDPSNADLFNTAQNKILNGENLGLGTSAVRTDAYDTRLESPVFTTADPGNGYRANGVPSKIMSVGGDDGSVAQDTVRFYKGIPVLYNVSVDFSDQVQHPELISAQ